jgi:NDP-sugar pyrophosphorylase family protein
MQAVVLAGGKGKRLLPLTKVFPKPLVPLGEKPILDIILHQLKHFGFTRVSLAVGHMADIIQMYIGAGTRYGIEIDYSYEEMPLGTVGPLAHIKSLEKTFLVMNGDLVTDFDYRRFLNYHEERGALATIATYKKPFKVELGIIHSAKDNIIVDYTEKPTYHYNVSMGIYAFDSSVLSYIEPNKYLDLPELIKRLLARRESVLSYPFEGYWLDLGNYSDYEKAVEEFDSLKGGLHLE